MKSKVLKICINCGTLSDGTVCCPNCDPVTISNFAGKQWVDGYRAGIKDGLSSVVTMVNERLAGTI